MVGEYPTSDTQALLRRLTVPSGYGLNAWSLPSDNLHDKDVCMVGSYPKLVYRYVTSFLQPIHNAHYEASSNSNH